MKEGAKLKICFAVGIVSVILLIAVIFLPTSNKRAQNNEKPKNREVVIKLKAVGDNLIHSPIYKKCETNDGYDFSGLYKNIKTYLEDADIAVINQETILVDDKKKYSGYPLFGTPQQIGDDIVKAGFNVVLQASNHTYDKGEYGIENTLNFWKKYDNVHMLGINESSEAAQKIDIFEKDGFKVALINFTYGLNGMHLPRGKEYLVNILDCAQEDKALLQKAEKTADLTVVFVHFGTEYTHIPTDEQMRDVEFLCENGADLIIGAHPHVIQPMGEYTSQNGNKAVVFYSLGNFVSNQDGTDKVLGAMASVTLKKANGIGFVKDYEMLPTVTHASSNGYSVYMLQDYEDSLAKKHTRCGALTVAKLENLYEDVNAIECKTKR